MKALSLVIVCLLVVAAFVKAQDPNNTTPTPKPVDDTTTKAATTAITTTVGTTTSDAPTTTTTPLPSEPKAGFWHVNTTDTSDYVCILVNLGARFTFTYVDGKNKTQQVITDLPSGNTTTASGHCSNDSTYITLAYKDDCTMNLTFQNINKKFSVKTVDLSFSNLTKCVGSGPSQPKVSPVTGSIGKQTLFQATVGQSYMCNSEQTLNVTKNNIQLLKVEFVDVQVQAYMNQKSLDFGTAQECPQDAETSNIVPIAVGAALAALVLIVLIAYLISRNRGQRGYESV